MNLWPEGERGRRLSRAVWSALLIWFTVQSMINLLRWHNIDGNLASLANELNISSEENFRRDFLEAMQRSKEPVTAEDIQVLLDEESNQYRVSVHTIWTVGFGLWTLRIPTVRQTWLMRSPYLPGS
jgi:hypothetical protein